MNAKTEVLLADLGVSRSDLERLAHLPREQATSLLASLQARARVAWRKLALELHPDRTGNDPHKAARFRALALVKDRLDNLVLPPSQPPPVVAAFTADRAPFAPGVVYGSVRTRPPKRPARVGHVVAGMKP